MSSTNDDYIVERYNGYHGSFGSYRSNGNGTHKIVFLVPSSVTRKQIEAIANEARTHFKVDRLDALDKKTANNIRNMIDRRVLALP